MTQYISLHPNAKDLTGEKFGRLLALGPIARTKSRSVFWLCRCECGTIKAIASCNLVSGGTVSCGCYHKEVTGLINKTHGMKSNSLYNTWIGMRNRCNNPKNPQYFNYGGRGISVCAEWENSFEVFHAYVTRLENCKAKGYSLDRTNNDGNYEPGNVRWSTQKEQTRNLRKNVVITYNGKTQCLVDWITELLTHRVEP